MKCKICKKESELKEIRGTMGIKTIFCCGEVQVDIDSLRPKVREFVIEEEKLRTNLTKEIDNLVQHHSTLEE